MTTEIQKLTTKFVNDLEQFTVQSINARLQDVLRIGLVQVEPKARDAAAKGLRSTPIESAQDFVARKRARAQRRKGPVQICPIKNCTNRAAPIYHMVCAKHKDLPKSKIKAARDARRAAKAR
jgi:hypothetical protein